MQHFSPASNFTPPTFQDLRMRMRALSVYRDVLDDDIGDRVANLLTYLSQWEESDEPDDEAVDNFAGLVDMLLEEATHAVGHPMGDPWQNYLLDRVLTAENLFSEAAERRRSDALGPGFQKRVQEELRTLQGLYELSLNRWQQAVARACPDWETRLRQLWPEWEPIPSGVSGAQTARPAGETLKVRLAESEDWGALLEQLAGHYASAGTGIFGQYWAFRWVQREHGGELEGVEHPDPIRVADLVGYDREQEAVLRNTRHFVTGAPGNNVLIYGDAGTGKSSFVKALLNEFGPAGLRLVEVPKERLIDFPYISHALRGRAERFIIFVDDLSFEESETEYKALKALLEGSVEARPDNVLVYATSNRRHLVRENFGDRADPGSEDIHPFESMQEKISLSERFGLRVAFLSPEQDRYLTIVRSLAENEGVALPEDALRQRALQWAQWQHGFSGRTARQFVNDLIGALAEERSGG